MRVASVCSGIGGAELAFHGIASHAFAAETDPFARAVLAHRFPGLKVHHDFTQIPASAGPVDVLVGGTPCQSFSIAGLRGGMADERGNLALEFLGLAERLKPEWILWENVPGVLSSNDGKDFAVFLDGLEEIGYITDVDILDAQFFGLAQRRRRVFVCAQRAESLLKAKTLSSTLTIAQCLIEISVLLLGALRSQSATALEDLAFDAGRPVLSLQRRMRLFGLDSAGAAQMLRENLAAIRLLSATGQSASGLESGSADWETSGVTRLPRSNGVMEPWRAACLNIDPSWSEFLADASLISSESITSTCGNEITERIIFSSAQRCLYIAAHIIPSMISSPAFWSAASSVSTALEAFIDYAGQTSSDLFTDPQWLRPWCDFLRQAERAIVAFDDLRIRSFGSLFSLRESLRGHPAPSREAGKRVAPTLASRASAGGGLGTDFDCDGGLIARCLNAHPNRIDGESETFVAHPLRAQAQPSHRADSDTYIAHSLRADGFDASEDGTGRGTPLVAFDARQSDTITYGDMSGPLDTDGHSVAVAFAQNQRDEVRCMDVAGALAAEPGAKQQTYAYQQSQSGFRQHETHATLDSNNGSRRRNGVVQALCEGGHGVTEMDTATAVQSGGGKAGQGYQAVREGASSVRRLTPRECERLQGFPEINKSATILVCCSDHQKTSALAEIQSLRSPVSASTAVERDSRQSANPADGASSTNLPSHGWPVVLSVHIDLERPEVRIVSAEKCLWSASGAGGPSSSPLPIPLAAFVRLLAAMPTTPANVTIAGEAGLPQNTTHSIPQENGSLSAIVSGQEIVELAADATKFIENVGLFSKSTTSPAGLSSQNCGLTLETWSSYVAAAIISFIHEPIQSGCSFAIRVEITDDWTDVVYRGKPAADGPRYRALGNAFAVPVVRWIARRIAREDAQ